MNNGPERQQQAQEFQDTAQMSSNDKSKFDVFNEYKDRLADVLVFSLTSLASRAASKRLIANAAAVSADKVGKITTQKERATFLIDMVMSKMDKNLEEAAHVMQKFLESIDEHAHLHKFLSDKYEEAKKKKTRQPEKTLLTDLQAQIASNLEFGLDPVAGKLLASDIITSAQHKVLVNAAATFEQLAIYNILKEIGESIKIDETKFRVFIEDVLEEIGGPAETLAEKMREPVGDDTT